MDNLKPCLTHLISTNKILEFRGLAFDDCYYYLTVPNNSKIYKYDKSMKLIDSIEVCKAFNCICFDKKNNCFWASASNCIGKIFKLNKVLKQIDCINIDLVDTTDNIISGISCNLCTNSLLVSFSNFIVKVPITKPTNSTIIKKCNNKLILGVLSLSPYYMVIYLNNSKQYVEIYSSNGKFINEYCFSKQYIVNDIILYPCNEIYDDSYIFEILVTENSYNHYLLKYILSPNELGINICKCNFHSCEKYTCHNNQCDKDCCHHKKTNCNDVITSIALIQASIAHILNAEGEKLQKIISTSNNVCEILKVNDSVNKMIINVTHLEHILYSNLDTINQICYKECTDQCNSDCKPNCNLQKQQ